MQMSVGSINFRLGESKLSQSRDSEVTDTKWMEGLKRWLSGQEHFPSSSIRGLELILILKWPTTACNSCSQGPDSGLIASEDTFMHIPNPTLNAAR